MTDKDRLTTDDMTDDTRETGLLVGNDLAAVIVAGIAATGDIIKTFAIASRSPLTIENTPTFVQQLFGSFMKQAGVNVGATEITVEAVDPMAEAPMEGPKWAGRDVSLGPAVAIKKSVAPDFLTSLENGQKYKTLSRHLKSEGLTSQEYREKWGLPADYPMVAAEYSALRAERAKAQGLGSKVAAPAAATPKRATAGARGR